MTQTLGALRHYSMRYCAARPSPLPGVLTGFMLGRTMGRHGAVSAEQIKSSIGLGFLLHMGRELNDVAQVIGMMLVTIVLGLLIDWPIFARIERRNRRLWGHW